MWRQEEEQEKAQAWVRDVEEEMSRLEEEQEIAEAEIFRMLEEKAGIKAHPTIIGQSRFEKLPQEVCDAINCGLVRSITQTDPGRDL